MTNNPFMAYHIGSDMFDPFGNPYYGDASIVAADEGWDGRPWWEKADWGKLARGLAAFGGQQQQPMAQQMQMPRPQQVQQAQAPTYEGIQPQLQPLLLEQMLGMK